MKLKSKLFAGVLGAAMVLSTVAIPASAQTTAELTAQINSLLAMIAQLQAQIAGTTPTTGAGMMFTSDLTIGSTGAEVTALQQWLVSKGYLVMPAGVAYGYFGPLTQSALAKYQAEAGISPAVGYFGPITRAKVNAMAGTTPTVPGTTPTTPGAGITTPGVEGTLAVTSSSAGIASTVYEGDSMASVLGMKVDAKQSDIAIQRIKLDLGTATTIFNKIYSRLYVTEGGNTLASVDLNSSTVVKDGGRYYVTITGFNLVVPKDSSRTIVVKADVRNTVDTSDIGSYTLMLDTNGVRGVDGAGIDQYAGSNSITRSVSVQKSLSDSAALKLSLNNASPKKMDVVAADGSTDDELDKVSMLTFDVKAEKDAVMITDLTVDIVYSDSGLATVTTLYLFDGSTEIDNSASNGVGATFSDIDVTVAKDSTKTFTVKADVRDANGTIRNITLDVDAADIVAENSQGDTVTPTGSAQGYTIGVRNVGAEVSLVSKSISTSGVAQTNGSPVSTSTLTATFNVKVKAVGGDLLLGSVASATPVFGPSTSFKLYYNGQVSSENLATSTSFTIPSTCTTFGTNSCTLAEGSEITIPVTFQVPGRTADGSGVDSGLYSVGLEAVHWNNGQSSSFMAGEVDWRTNDVSFP